MGGDEHVVGLYRGSDEKTGEGYHRETEAAAQVLICKSLHFRRQYQGSGGGAVNGFNYIGIIVFGKYVQEATVDIWFNVVELGNVCVLEPIHEHFRTKDKEEGSQYLAYPVGEDGKAEREDTGAPQWDGGTRTWTPGTR